MTGDAPVEPIHLPQQVAVDLGAFVPRAGAATPGLSEADREELVDLRNGLEVGTWEGTPGEFRAQRDGYSEVCHILGGRATLHTDGADSVEVEAGDTIIFPSGWSGRWQLHAPMRKLYVIVHDRP